MFLEEMNYVFIVILCIRLCLPSIVVISYLSALSVSQIDSKCFMCLKDRKGFLLSFVHMIILCQQKIFGLKEVMDCSLVSLRKYNNGLLL